ncbi:MAG: hypothetical protein U1B83_02690, partial [Candidatus Cloacimonadaceae bacterium]|nr:hypothetical protein [Candidatus Cloacimonadaceae bacterium]
AQSFEQRYLPLRLVLLAGSRELFIRFYRPGWGIEERDALLREIKALKAQDYLYLDKDLELFDLLSSEQVFPMLQNLMGSHFALLDQLAKIRNIADLCRMIDLPGALEIRAMCSPRELNSTDIQEQFYERLANFGSIENLGIVSHWQVIYAERGSALGARILDLFCQYLKSARYRYQKPGGAQPQYEIGNLLDSRDLAYDEVIFFHAIEGEIPSNPGPVWLLNETQRAKLGLKSFTQIRDWERYYFFRLILCAHEARIYCYRNQENDVEPGSFVSELLMLNEHGGLPGFEVLFSKSAPLISSLYEAKQAAANAQSRVPGLEDAGVCGFEAGDAFFSLPCEPDKDFLEGKIKTSYYNLAQMMKNPFA